MKLLLTLPASGQVRAGASGAQRDEPRPNPVDSPPPQAQCAISTCGLVPGSGGPMLQWSRARNGNWRSAHGMRRAIHDTMRRAGR